jgi:CBS domain-containing protein
MRATVRDLMTPDPVTVDESTPLQQVALVMKEQDIGDVIVERQGTPAGIVTDRDIVVRALAENEDARTLQAGDICSGDVVSVGPDDGIDAAAGLMRDAAVRRVPVVDDGRVVGIVSLGDLARREDPGSVLSDISDDPPND